MTICRECRSLVLTLGTGLATTPEITFGDFIAGAVYIPSGSPITQLAWYGAAYQTGDVIPGASTSPTAPVFQPAFDGSYPTPVSVSQNVAAGRSYAIPAPLLGFASLKCVVNAAGSVVVSLKS